MKFKIKNKNKCIQRLGILSEIESKPAVSIKTPTAMLYTQGGHLPHITHEVFKLVSIEPQILQVPLTGMHAYKDAMQFYEGTISQFIGSKDSLSCLTVQDPSSITKLGHHLKNKIPIWTKSGKIYYDSDNYMELVESFRPDLYFFLSDGDTNASSPDKRVSKAVSNTVSLFKECLDRHRKCETLKNSFIIAPVAGGYNLSARDKCLQEITKDCNEIGGFLIDGLHNNGPETEFIDINKVIPVVHHVIDKLPTEKLRCLQGCWNPSNVIKLVKLGVDLFDTSYCYILTERSAAMTFAIDSDEDSDYYEINLRDARYADDFQPIIFGCKCLSCTKYTRAYIHHLLTTRELLGPQLIMIHNIHHYLRFFEKIRQSIEKNTINVLEMKIEEQLVNHLKLISPS